MKFKDFKNIRLEYKALYGENGKKYYALSRRFWNFIQEQLKGSTFRTKRDLAKFITKVTNEGITLRAIDSWFYHGRKPFLVDDFNVNRNSKNGCDHGFNYFCPICNLNKTHIETCPVPLLWTTFKEGKTYVYEKYWNELKHWIDNSLKSGLLLSNLYPKIKADERSIRRWRNNIEIPKIFTDDHFSFSKHNLYFLGLFLSDGHIRNNGSNLSFTYQTGSSEIFQGYWYPQFIQRFLPIFKHKKKLSNTYLILDKTNQKYLFKTNMSSISPIFIKKLIQHALIRERKISITTGWKKKIPQDFLKTLGSYEGYFQGVFDGDGSYGLYTSPAITLATTPEIDYSHFIDCLPLTPTTSNNKKSTMPYSANNKNIYTIRFAPDSIRNLPKKFAALDIVKQLDFFISSAHNSIRPDKVYKLIKIIKVITSNNYGENTNSIPIQKEIRDIAVKVRLVGKIESLEKRYPIKNSKYQPFMPKWAEELCSKNEAWNFFFRKENLIFKHQNKLRNIDFSGGIPINFKL
jgi:hypothetical protein